MNSIQICPELIADERSTNTLLELLKLVPGLFTEVGIFTSSLHSPLPIEKIYNVVERISAISPKLREAGFKVGINHLTTIGHLDENISIAVEDNLPRQIGMNGLVCKGTLCLASEVVQNYIEEFYRLLASAAPDFIWINDDVRLDSHSPAIGCCVCEHCLEEFSQQVGERFSREGIIEAFNGQNIERQKNIRNEFMVRNSALIEKVLLLIARTVHAINPEIELGFMTGDRFWEGYDFKNWAKAMSGPTKTEVRWRPGCGFYNDDTPGELLRKTHEIGRQCSFLPDKVVNIQSEIENFPYAPLQKSRRMTALEIATYIFAGCSGAALNIFGAYPQQIDEHKPLLKYLNDRSEFWSVLSESLKGTILKGIWPAWIQTQVTEGKSVQLDNGLIEICGSMNDEYTLAELGLPVCYQHQNSCMTVLSGDIPRALGFERMRNLLSGGVLLDTEALIAIDDMGLAELTGVKIGDSYDSDTYEVLTDHPLNQYDSGKVRDCRQSFPWANRPVFELVTSCDRIEVLARLRDYQGIDRGASVTIFENELGGRVGVMSYFPWKLNQFGFKRRQISHICNWISKSNLPLLINSNVKITPWVRESRDGRMIVGLLNLSSDRYTNIELTIQGRYLKVARLTMSGMTKPIEFDSAYGSTNVSVPNIEPFSFNVLYFEN